MVDFNEAKKDFAKNPDRRCACVLVLDTSGSMSGEPVEALNRALAEDFQKALNKDEVARKRLDIAVVSFGGEVKVEQDFVSAYNFTAPSLDADGETPMGSAVLMAAKMVRERKDQYKDAGLEYYRPWIFLLTDGTPQGEPDGVWEEAIEAVREGEENKGFNFFAVGVGDDVDMESLRELSKRPPLPLRGLDFRSMFLWLSQSLGNVAHSSVNEEVPTAQLDWAAV